MMLLPCRRLIVALMLGLAVACSKPTADEHAKRGDDYLSRSMLQEAIIEYRNAIQIDPRRGDVRLKLAEAHLQVRNLNEALREFVRAADLLPNDATAQVKAGNILLAARAFEDAQARANNAIALDPKNADAIILLGNSKAGLNNLDGALDEYQEAATLNPTDRVYAGMGILQTAKGDMVAAEASFRKATEIAPTSMTARLALANFLWSANRRDEAETELKAALAVDGTNLLANRALGVFYLSSGRSAEAEPYFRAIADTAKSTEATLVLADYYVVTKKFDDARKTLQSLASDDKAWPVATTRLAAIDAIEGLRVKGIERLTEVLGKFPNDQTARLLLARLYLADGKREEAIKEATHLVEADPRAPITGSGYMLIGMAQAALDRPEAAIKAYEEALSRSQQPLEPALALAQLHLSAGAVDKAQTYVQQALALQPKLPYARALRVRILLVQRKTAEANTELAALQKEYPNAPPVLNLLAAQQLTSGNLTAARASYERSAQVGTNDIESLAGLVQLDLMANKPADALRRVDAALKANAKSSDLYILAARAYGAARQWEPVEDLLKKAIDLDPARLKAYGLLAEFYIRQNRLGEAEEQFKTMVVKNPSSIAINTMLGMLYDMRGNFAEAEKQYEKVLALDSNAAVAANNLAYRLAESDRNLDQALQLAQTAQRRLPGEPNVGDTLGWVYFKKRMTSQAMRELEAAAKVNAKDPLVHFHLGMTYIQAGIVDKAKESLRTALNLSTSFPNAEEAKKQLASIGG